MTNKFPITLINIIVDYAAIWTIVPWIRAIENTIKIFPESSDRASVKTYHMCRNPMAMDEIKSQKDIYSSSLMANSSDWAFDMIESKISHCELYSFEFLRNSNPRAIAYIEKNIDLLTPDCWTLLLRNPGAIELIKKYNGMINASQPWEIMMNSNEATWELIKNLPMIKNVIDHRYALSHNSSSWAARLLIENNIEPDIVGMCSSPYIDVIDNVSKHISYFDEATWATLCSNPVAMHILREHPDQITDDIWSNPAIFEPTPRPGVLDILTELSWSGL